MAKVSWKGSLGLGLINVPVGAIPVAESSATISFNQIHEPCKAKISQKRICTACSEEVTKPAKGYEFAKGQFMVVPEDKLNALQIESDKRISLTAFVEDDVDPLLIKSSYYLVPDGAVVGPYAVIRKALEVGNKTAIGTVSMFGREYQCAVAPRGQGFVMHLLYTAAEVRSIDRLDQFSALAGIAINPQEVKMAATLMAHMDDEVDLTEFKDRRGEGIRQLLDDLLNGREVATPTVETPQATTGSLMASLEAMLATVPAKKSQAKAKMVEKVAGGQQVMPLARAARKAPKKKSA